MWPRENETAVPLIGSKVRRRGGTVAGQFERAHPGGVLQVATPGSGRVLSALLRGTPRDTCSGAPPDVWPLVALQAQLCSEGAGRSRKNRATSSLALQGC